MPKRLSAARREIIHAYNVVRQTPGEGTIVYRVSVFLGRKIDTHKNNSFVRRVINEYIRELAQ